MNTKRFPQVLAAVSFSLLAGAVSLRAQSNLSLSITPQSISFAAADPDVSSTITANQTVNVTIRSTLQSNRNWRLTLLANGDLIASTSSATISISNISWTATPTPPFQAGTLAANVSQTAASGSGSYQATGYLTFIFKNSWSYWAGSYSQTVTFTLSQV